MSLRLQVRLPAMSDAPPTFTHVSTVAIPVADQDRAQTLFEQLGFTTRFDAELAAGFRWIEVVAPGATTSIALVSAGDDLPCGIDTGIRLVAPDARAAHDAVLALGLDAGDLLDWEGVPLMFSFTDLDGNRLYVTEPG